MAYPKTQQAIFDFIAPRLYKQGIASVDGSGTCQYRGPHDTKCAVGFLIPNSVYKKTMEGKTVDALVRFNGDKTSKGFYKFLSDNQHFLTKLQSNCHDSIAFWEIKKKREYRTELLRKLSDFAVSFNLIYDEKKIIRDSKNIEVV